MPRSTCPNCGAVLQITDDMVNDQIECGSCHAVFVARPDPPPSRRGPDEERPSRRRMSDPDGEERPSRRRDDDEDRPRRPGRFRDDDDEDYRRPRRKPGQPQGMAIASLVLGSLALVTSFLSLVCCIGYVAGPLAIMGIIFGVLGLKQNKGMSIGGIATGSLAILIMIIMIVVFGAILALGPRNNPPFGPQRNQNPPFGPQRNNPPPPRMR